MNCTDTADETRNLAALERILTDVRDEHHAIAEAMTEAITICQSRSVAHASIHCQLRNALETIRIGRPGDAPTHIKHAIDILARWSGDVTR